MEIQSLVPVEWSNQLVLISKQVADAYGCKPKRIHDNFTRAKEQFQEGVHYFKLTGEELRQFKHYTEKNGVQISPATTHLYLWTYQGCARHCKMLNTPQAWAMFDELERVYFGIAESKVEVPTLPAPEVIALKEEVVRLQNQYTVPSDFAVVYALLMSNGTVKIGMTKDLTERIKNLKTETGLFVLNYATTPFMARDDAAALEQFLLDKFSAYSLGGEFFDVKFTLAAADL